MKNILFIVGSLRQKSFNRQLAKVVEKEIGNRANVSYLVYNELPFMNEDLENPDFFEVRRVKEVVYEADAIWIFTPEYNGFIPGVLKNLLDWLSRKMENAHSWKETAIANKPVTYCGAAGKSGSLRAQAQLETLLPSILMDVMPEDTVKVQIKAEDHETQVLTLSDEEQKAIQKQVSDFLDFIEK